MDRLLAPQSDTIPVLGTPLTGSITFPTKGMVLGRFGGYKVAVVQTNMGAECRDEIEVALERFPNAQAIIGLVHQKGGYSTLRPNQYKAINSFLEGKDVFVTLPTGSGKSLSFAILPFAFDDMYGRVEQYLVDLAIGGLHTQVETYRCNSLEEEECTTQVNISSS
ncbi:hypothetical protein EMCRGX_G030076 [Ephydatia muelleri]